MSRRYNPEDVVEITIVIRDYLTVLRVRLRDTGWVDHESFTDHQRAAAECLRLRQQYGV
jgi:hypothetical protein